MDPSLYPPQQMLSRSVVKAIAGGALGTKSLSEADLRKVLYLGGLEDVNQVTYADVQDFFNRAGTLLRARCGRNDVFSWARVCPMALLANKWSSMGFKNGVDGSSFLPPNNRQAKGVSVQQKRLVVFVAVHLSPFYAKVFEQHFEVARESGQKKRLRPKDPFDDAKKPAAKTRKKRRTAGDGGKLTRAAQLTAVNMARARAAEASRVAATSTDNAAAAAAKSTAVTAAKNVKGSGDAAAFKTTAAGTIVAGGRGNGGGAMCPAAYMPLCTLERQSAQMRMHVVWLREPTALLPATTLLSVVSLTGAALSDAARASMSVRVVLPRELLMKAFSALTSAKDASGKDASPSTTLEHTGEELAVQLNLGNYDPVFAFSTTLMQMSSVLALNEAIESSRTFVSWLAGLTVSNAFLPAQLNFLSGEAVRVASLAEVVRTDIGARLLSDCVWAYPRVGRQSTGTQSTEGAFGGCSVGVRDVCDAGQRTYLTNALLDAGLAELHQRCAGASVSTGVLSCTQSASFTSIGSVEVALPRAMLSISEVLSTWGPSVEQFVMLINMGNTHWVSASVSLVSGSVTLYDSLGGPSTLKTLIVSRLLLFARQAELRRRVLLTGSAAESMDWIVEDELNVPAQQDSYNCGLFAFAYIWCFVYGQDFATVAAVGDELRLSLMHFIIQSGRARAAQTAGNQ